MQPTNKEHSFIKAPHRTMVMLSLPVLISLVAEPLTGLVDTAFVARLGTIPLAALGVGTTALSSAFWIFNFLSIGTQTSVAQALGKQDTKRGASGRVASFLSNIVLPTPMNAVPILIIIYLTQPDTTIYVLGAQADRENNLRPSE